MDRDSVVCGRVGLFFVRPDRNRSFAGLGDLVEPLR